MKTYKLNLKRIIDTATRLEGKKVSISRAQMSEARRCIFAAIELECLRRPDDLRCGDFWNAIAVQAFKDCQVLGNIKPKPARRRHK